MHVVILFEYAQQNEILHYIIIHHFQKENNKNISLQLLRMEETKIMQLFRYNYLIILHPFLDGTTIIAVSKISFYTSSLNQLSKIMIS